VARDRRIEPGVIVGAGIDHRSHPALGLAKL
jgi:hypothetical protein